MDFTVTVQRAKDHAASLRRLTRHTDSAFTQQAERELTIITAMLEGAVKAETPVITGVLRASEYSEVNIRGVSVEGLVSTPIIYGPPVEFGKKADASGKGGFEGRKMFERAWKENAGKVSQRLNAIGVQIAEELLKAL